MWIKYFLFFTLAFIVKGNVLFAQESSGYSDVKRNGAYIEGYFVPYDLVDGYISYNYERVLGKKRQTNLRLGILPDYKGVLAFPFTVSWITNSLAASHFEYGLGFVYWMDFSHNNFSHDIPAAVFPFMYRYQKEKGFIFRVGFNLFVGRIVTFSPSASVGYKF